MTVDLKFEKGGESSTLMWTPLHFATYFGKLSVLQYFIDELKISCPMLCLTKLPADNEEDISNSLKFIEDKTYALMLAFERNHMDIFKYLIEKFPKEWPK